MPRSNWYKSDRLSRLPSDWKKIRERVGARDNWMCQHRYDDGIICGSPSTDVDHIIPNDDDSDENLQCLCSYHHSIKSSREGGQASAAALDAAKRRVRRPQEQTPFRAPANKPQYPGF